MQSPCFKDVSKACSSSCCTNPCVGLPLQSNTALSTSQILRHEFELCTANSLYPNFQFTNHESLPLYDELFASFNKVYPQYSETDRSENIRAREYRHLSLSKHVCLDYIGHGLFSYAQLQSSLSLEPPFFDMSYKSVNLNSQLLLHGESEFQSDVRKRIMAFMNVSESDYLMILTANQSSAFKVLSDCYPFQCGEKLLTVYDYQNEAVELMIESSKKRGANVMSADFVWPELQIRSENLRKKIVSKSKYKRRGLFVFPIQSRVTGSRYSYEWMSLARENGWHVLLDASALGAKDMETLGLSLFNPDFIICSFFKVFGDNPSGFCCLFIKKSSASILNDSSSATNVGIVNLVPSRPTRIECRSLDHADSIGLILISTRTRNLINWLVNALMSLKHPNSDNEIPIIKIYGPQVKFDRGPAVAFNVFDWKGERIDPGVVQKLADRNNISLSIGILQHIWFRDKHEEQKILKRRTSEGTLLTKKRDKFHSGISVVTVSLSFLTNFEDVYRVWAFVSRFLDADFLEKEKWRYKALNQETIEV